MFVIILDRDLDIYQIDDNQVNNQAQKVYSLTRSKHTLELSGLFETIWQDLWIQGLGKINKILYIVGENASFTDNRMVFIWLKSWCYFGYGDYYCATLDLGVPTNLRLFTRWTNSILDKALINPEDLDYQKTPKITIKEVFGK